MVVPTGESAEGIVGGSARLSAGSILAIPLYRVCYEVYSFSDDKFVCPGIGLALCKRSRYERDPVNGTPEFALSQVGPEYDCHVYRAGF